MELYIIRHGQSSNNAIEDQTQRQIDAPLTPLGHKQAEVLGHYLATTPSPDPVIADAESGRTVQYEGVGYGIQRLFCSAMLRALQTARPIAKALGITPEIWVELHERGGVYHEEAGQYFGRSGLTRAEVAAQFTDYLIPETLTETGWWNRDYETVDLCYSRAQSVVAQLRAMAGDGNTGQRIAIVTHGTFTSVLLRALMGVPDSEDYFFWHYNTSIARVDYFVSDGRVIIRYVNRISHLTPDLVS